MDTPAKLDQVLVHLEYLRTGMDQVNTRLDHQNGRVRTVELAVGILEDRQSSARNSGAKWGAGFGAMLGAAVAAAWQLIAGSGK